MSTLAIEQRNLSSLECLESEAIFVIRELQAEFERPVFLFSGGKDSIVVSHLARKAFWPGPIPFPFLHIDTDHNFPETLEHRDRWMQKIGGKLIVREVEETIRQGRVQEEKGPGASRNTQQSVTLLDALREFKFDAAVGGARRDEEKARSKERFFSFRNELGQWDPKNQRPELWSLYNGRKKQGEHFRVFPISNWTEMDVWLYVQKEQLEIPSLYFSHDRVCIERGDMWLAYADCVGLKLGETPQSLRVRFRTIGDMTCTGAVLSEASTIEGIIDEVATSRISERGTRADDHRSSAAMEERKREGYF